MATKILVVDDEPDLELLVRQKFRKKIQENEIEFQFARNGVEALQKLYADTELNIILTDINMPEMDGLTLLSALPSLNRVYKAIVISAYGDMSNIRSAMNKGASDFIIKPIDFQDLEITIAKIIDQYNQLKEALAAKLRLIDIDKELEVARKIQESMLPKSFENLPNRDRFELYGKVFPAKEVSGDFFDYFKIDEQRFAFVIADVSGKSISAALFMATSRALIRYIGSKSTESEEVLNKVNDMLCSNNDSCMFVTVFYGILDTISGELQYCNAGHNPPYILSNRGSIQKIGTENGLAMGVLDSKDLAKVIPYKRGNIRLAPGDKLVCITDGIVEAMRRDNALYGEERLLKVLAEHGAMSLQEIAASIIEGLKEFTGDVAPSDDITMLMVKFLSGV